MSAVMLSWVGGSSSRTLLRTGRFSFSMRPCRGLTNTSIWKARVGQTPMSRRCIEGGTVGQWAGLPKELLALHSTDC